jgi:hypothetical protein
VSTVTADVPAFVTSAGTLVTVLGANLGPDNSATGNASITKLGLVQRLQYGPYEATGCSVSLGGTKMVCATVDGVGASLAATVTVGNQPVSPAGLALRYRFPTLTALACVQPNGTRGAVMPTTGCDLEASGTDFGPIVAVNAPNMSLRGPYATLGTQNCSVTVAHTTVRCWLAAGVGASYVATLNVAQRVNVTNASLLLSFAGPTISALSGALNMRTAGGENVTLTGSWFGPAGTPVTVQYGSAGNMYNASGCSVTAEHTEIVCATVAGVGANLTWSVTVGLQTASSAPLMTSYIAPTVDGASSTPVPAATIGGSQVTLSGQNLGPASPQLAFAVTYYAALFPSVVYNATGCSGAHTTLTCTLSTGVGASLVFSVQVGRQNASAFSSSVRYATPSVVNVSGAAPFNTAGGESATVTVSGDGPAQRFGH